MWRALLFCIIATPCLGAWRTNSVSPSLTDIGELIRTAAIAQQIMYEDETGDDHVGLWYHSSPYAGTIHGQLFDVNVTDGSAVIATGSYGRMDGTEVYTNGVLYKASGSPAWFQCFDTTNGTITIITNLSDSASSSICIGHDGKIYVAQYGHGKVDSYDPATGVWVQHGQADTNYAGESQYGYTVGMDGQYIYVGLGQSPWYLGIIDTVSGVHSTYFSEEGNSTSRVMLGNDNNWYYRKIPAVGDWVYYILTNGTPVEVGYTPTLLDYDVRHFNVTVNEDYFDDDFGVWVDVSFAYPNSTNNWATLRWTDTVVTNWQTASVTNFELAPCNLKQVHAGAGESLYVMPKSYAPMLLYNADGTTTVYGNTGGSMFDANYYGGCWFLHGYTSLSFRHVTNTAWNLSGSTTDPTQEGVNPRQFSGSFGKDHYYGAFGSDNYLYIAGYHQRDSSGGEIGWYDTNTMAAVDSLRTGTDLIYSTNGPGAFTAVSGASKFIYLCNGNPRMYVFDVTNKVFALTNDAIMPHASCLGECVEVTPGIVLGVYATNIWTYNVATEVSWTNVLPGAAWSGYTYAYDRELEIGPDGYVWLTLGDDLYRVHPTTYSPELVKSGVGAHNVCFNGGDCYLYKPTTPELHVLTNLLVRIPDASTATLRVGAITRP